MSSKKNKLYVWSSDYSKNSGEGKLARLFIKKLNQKRKYKFILNKQRKYHKYISPFIGIIYCWEKYVNNKQVCYLNYLPLWNSLLFLLLPPKTLLGPITGGANYNKSLDFNYLIRKVLFPLFYKISEICLNIRCEKIFFSTSLLHRYLSNKIIKKSEFDFMLKNISIKKKITKTNDFIIYYRKHKNKINLFPYNFIKKLSNKKFKIIVVGDKLKIDFVKNLGFINNKKVEKIQSKTKYTLASSENIYSFFSLECLSNNVKIIVDKNYKYQVKHFKKKFIILDLKKFNNFKKLK